jgi:hypothetical protein
MAANSSSVKFSLALKSISVESKYCVFLASQFFRLSSFDKVADVYRRKLGAS